MKNVLGYILPNKSEQKWSRNVLSLLFYSFAIIRIFLPTKGDLKHILKNVFSFKNPHRNNHFVTVVSLIFH